MCGIVGYIGTQNATNILLSGLEKLEYRGYDSAGLATITQGKLDCVRAKGKLFNLKNKVGERENNDSSIGIGHTRWATHGKPEEYNAHPHLDMTGKIAVVQNGIVENYRELKAELIDKGYQFVSDTDTEVIPHLISDFLYKQPKGANCQHNSALFQAVQQAVNCLQGAFAIAVLSADYPDELIVARQQAPISIGFGQGEFFCASDTPALVAHTQVVLNLENGELARLTHLGVEVYNFQGDRLHKIPRVLNFSPTQVEKQIYKHFMLKEIHEQPGVVRAILEKYIDQDWIENAATNKVQPNTSPINLGLSEKLSVNLEQVEIYACGTSWHASLVGKYLLEQVAQLPTRVDYASEARYAPSPLRPNSLIIGVTQSGETADTLAAIATEQQRRAIQPKEYAPRILGITNRAESSIAQIADHIIDIQAGIEIGVAATKTFTAQVMAFYLLALQLAWQKQTINLETLLEIINQLKQLPGQMENVLAQEDQHISELAHELKNTQDVIFIGRGINFPIALEGALKLKEISYIHADGYPAGEMKHGPIALLDEKVPVVTVAVPGIVYEKVLSNAQEAKARDARLIGVTVEGEEADIFRDILAVPVVNELLSPLLTVIPLQLLAYHIAAHKGLDVDQPRNLAKSVTVE